MKKYKPLLESQIHVNVDSYSGVFEKPVSMIINYTAVGDSSGTGEFYFTEYSIVKDKGDYIEIRGHGYMKAWLYNAAYARNYNLPKKRVWKEFITSGEGYLGQTYSIKKENIKKGNIKIKVEGLYWRKEEQHNLNFKSDFNINWVDN